MATSSKVVFKLDTLRAKALESINHRVAMAEVEVASYDDDEALERRVEEWREHQVGRIMTMYARLTGPTEEQPDNHALSKFKLDAIPEVDRWDRSRAERTLRELQAKRTQIEAKGQALVPDAEGNIALTKTQLSEFFGL